MKNFRCKIFVLAVMLVMMCATAWADVEITDTYFPDEYFRNYIKSNFDGNGNNVLEDSEISAVRTMELSSYSISTRIATLKGIEYFTALTALYCNGNQLTSLDVSKNTALTLLYCDNNQLTTLDVSKNTALTTLYCYSNQLTSLDVSKNTALKTLRCENNQLTALDVSKCLNLDNLHCENNKFTSANLSSNTSLTELYCDYPVPMSDGKYQLNLTKFEEAYGIADILGTPSDDDRITVKYKLGSIINTSIAEVRTPSSNFVLSLGGSGVLEYVDYSHSRSHLSVRIFPSSTASDTDPDPSPQPSNTKPSITTTAIDIASVGEKYSFQLTASGSTPITWTFSGNLPAGLMIDTSGLISGTPAKKGKKKITVTATNSYGSAKKSFTINVQEGPSIKTEKLDDAIIGKSYNKVLSGKGTTPFAWELEGELPTGIKFNAKTAKISGKPKNIEEWGNSYTLTVTLSNPIGSVSKTFTFTLRGIAPTITSTKLSTGTYGKSYSYTLKAKGTQPIYWTIAEGELPAGLELNTDTGKIEGTPLEVCNKRRIVIHANNNEEAYADKEFFLTIKAVAPKITTKSPLPEVLVNTPYTAQLEDEGTPAITWSAQGLPPGLSITSDGTISGTPTQYGTFNVKVTASNPADKPTKKTFKLLVSSVPVFNESGTLADGKEKKSYTHKLNVSGSTPITYSITGGTLPAGITINAEKGTLKGTPKAAGDYTFTVRAANSAGSAEATFSLSIAAKSAKASSLQDDYEIYRQEYAGGDVPEDSASGKAENYAVVAVLPEVSVDVAGMYDFSVTISDDAKAGEELVYLAGSSEPSEDDSIAEFFDGEGQEIDAVPDNRRVSVSVWLNEGRNYAPAIAVKR